MAETDGEPTLADLIAAEDLIRRYPAPKIPGITTDDTPSPAAAIVINIAAINVFLKDAQ